MVHLGIRTGRARFAPHSRWGCRSRARPRVCRGQQDGERRSAL